MNIRFGLSFLLLCLFWIGTNTGIYGQHGASEEDTFNVNSNLILARPCPVGSRCARTWTLPTRFGEALNMAEELFGARDHAYTVLGIDFTTESNPKNWYPWGKKNIIILLTKGSAKDEKLALFQLGHETFHVLTPILGMKTGTTYLEEGLATYFSLLYLEKIGKPVTRNYFINSPKYVKAYDDIIALTKIYPDMAQRIKAFRYKQPSVHISGITYRQFKQIFPDAPDPLAERLTATF